MMSGWLIVSRRLGRAIAGTLFLAGSLCPLSVLAADPFRTANPHDIGEQTEAAFRTIFIEGDYQGAKPYLEAALESEADEPMPYALKAAIAYLDGDWETFGKYATKSREVAEQLTATDPLRGNLYTALGHFFEGAFILEEEGSIKALPEVFLKLQQVFESFNNAERINPEDPELNLLKGYMDLMLAVALPFSDPAQAIARLEEHAAPPALVYRGLALGYRDLDEQEQATVALERAMELAPDNPDLYYLKAQILVRQDRDAEGLTWFEKALDKEEQLVPGVVKQIRYEHCRTQNRIDDGDRSCRDFLKG